MEAAALIGRILLAVPFVVSGIAHLTNREAMTGYAQYRGVPSPGPAVLASGVVILLGGAALITGVWLDLTAIVLIVYLVPVTIIMHPYWKADEATRSSEAAHVQKNIALIGGLALLIAMVAADIAGPALTGGLLVD